MNLTSDIADATIEKLKKEKQFENWSDEKFSRLRTLLTTNLSTEEEADELFDALLGLITGEEENNGRKTHSPC